jgi:antibiotic biosynthesis monooxygenase (ABM) superfamily enzyme
VRLLCRPDTENMARSGDQSTDRGRGDRRDDPVTAVFSWRARPGREEQFAEWAQDAHTATAQFPGHLSATVIHEDGSRDFHLIHQFAHQSDLQRWLDSAERRQWVARGAPLADARTAVQQRTGLETWFHVPSHPTAMMRPPPRWKMWLVSLLAIYPLVLAFQAFVSPQMASWPLPVRAALFPLVLLTLMTYAVMPVVTRALRRWL